MTSAASLPFLLELYSPAGCVAPSELPGEDRTGERYQSIPAATDAGRAILGRHSELRGFAVSTDYGYGRSRLKRVETRTGASYDASMTPATDQPTHRNRKRTP